MIRVIYIAGPYRAETTYGVYENIRRAEAVAIKLWRQGWAVLCPHLNTQLFDQCYELPPTTYLRGGLEMVKRCDAVYLLKGWENSQGARAERDLALELGLEIYYE